MGSEMQTEQLDFLKSPHQEAFEEFKATPEGGKTCNRFFRLAYGFLMRGQKIGGKLIVERLRWNLLTRKDPDHRYKINNNHTAYLVRWAIEKDPRLAEVFSLRGVNKPQKGTKALINGLHAHIGQLQNQLEQNHIDKAV